MTRRIFSTSRLARVNVECIDDERVWFRCKQCGQKWSPNLQPGGGKLSRGWWRCPNGCNGHIKNIDRPQETT